MNALGEKVVDLFKEATSELVIAAPFVKAATLSRLIVGVKPQVSIVCCTRWIPEEIACGITDVEVWDVLKSRPNCKLYLRSNLHAKYYRADSRCLVGSANVTAAALGWRPDSNLEILTSLDSSVFIEFESEMLETAILVDDTLYEIVRELVQQLKKSASRDERTLASDKYWVPSLRNPEELFNFYSGEGDTLSSASRVAAADDLARFPVSLGLSREPFEKYIALEFVQKPVIASIDSLLSSPQRFGAVATFIRKTIADIDADTAWQTTMRWMRYFLPKRYALSIPGHSEVFFRVEGISRPAPPSTALRQVLQTLNTDKSRDDWTAVSNYQAPHKPLLVLCILEFFDKGKIDSRNVEPSTELESLFNKLAKSLYPAFQLGEMSLPFFHLETDGFWKLVPRKYGSSIPEKARTSVTNLRTYVRYAELREEFYLALLKHDERGDASALIFKEYFPEEVVRRLRAALGDG